MIIIDHSRRIGAAFGLAAAAWGGSPAPLPALTLTGVAPGSTQALAASCWAADPPAAAGLADPEGSPARAETLAERRLRKLVLQQEAFLKRVKEAGEEGVDASGDDNLQREAEAVLQGYEAFLNENPDSIYGLILYGKFLRKVGEDERAFRVFGLVDSRDTKVAVVKQQLSAILAENGRFGEALGYILEAVELEPDTAVYHYQLAELLHTYRDAFVSERIFDAATVDQKTALAFDHAVRLDPANRNYRMRRAKAYYHVEGRDAGRALELWTELLPGAHPGIDTDAIQLHRADLLIDLGRADEARAIAQAVREPKLRASRAVVLDRVSRAGGGEGEEKGK